MRNTLALIFKITLIRDVSVLNLKCLQFNYTESEFCECKVFQTVKIFY